jgi:hypothetical protein
MLARSIALSARLRLQLVEPFKAYVACDAE